MKPNYYFNGKSVTYKKDIPKNAKLVQTKYEEYYEDETYHSQQMKNAMAYFARQREQREQRDAYHG